MEFAPADIPPTNADVVVLAGDIHLGPKGCEWARKQFPDKPVIYVPGNHEYYKHSLPELVETLKAEMDGSNVCVLENDAVGSRWDYFSCGLHVVDGFSIVRATPLRRCGWRNTT